MDKGFCKGSEYVHFVKLIKPHEILFSFPINSNFVYHMTLPLGVLLRHALKSANH